MELKPPLYVSLPGVVALLSLILWLLPDTSKQVALALLWWVPHDSVSSDNVRDLANQLLGGAVVAFAVLLAEALVNRENERRNLQLSIVYFFVDLIYVGAILV
jgi:hypothetical protein